MVGVGLEDNLAGLRRRSIVVGGDEQQLRYDHFGSEWPLKH